MGHRPTRSHRPPTWLERTRSRYVYGHINLIEFLEEMDRIFDQGIYSSMVPRRIFRPSPIREIEGPDGVIEIVVGFGSRRPAPDLTAFEAETWDE